MTMGNSRIGTMLRLLDILEIEEAGNRLGDEKVNFVPIAELDPLDLVDVPVEDDGNDWDNENHVDDAW